MLEPAAPLIGRSRGPPVASRAARSVAGCCIAGGRGVGRRRTGTGMLDLRSQGGSLGVLIVGSGRDAAGFRVPDPGVNFVGGGCDVGVS